MKKLILSILITALTYVSLNGCKHRINEGYIVGMEYEPYRTWFFLMPMHVNKTTIFIPMIMHDNEDYVITVKGSYKGEEKIEHFYIEKKQFDTLKLSDFVCVDGMCNKDKNNNKEKR